MSVVAHARITIGNEIFCLVRRCANAFKCSIKWTEYVLNLFFRLKIWNKSIIYIFIFRRRVRTAQSNTQLLIHSDANSTSYIHCTQSQSFDFDCLLALDLVYVPRKKQEMVTLRSRVAIVVVGVSDRRIIVLANEFVCRKRGVRGENEWKKNFSSASLSSSPHTSPIEHVGMCAATICRLNFIEARKINKFKNNKKALIRPKNK